MTTPYDTLHGVIDKLLAAWALEVAAKADVEPDEIQAIASFELGNIKAQITFEALETTTGDRVTREHLYSNLLKAEQR
jgi:hypothetical protein